ncbi:UNVERIFIED_CONTAM: hypothetical protein Sindi_1288800, partial [Sesamum indicum]
ERENPLFKGVKEVVEKENLGGFPKPLEWFMKMAMALGQQKAENHREDSERRGLDSAEKTNKMETDI